MNPTAAVTLFHLRNMLSLKLVWPILSSLFFFFLQSEAAVCWEHAADTGIR